MVPTALTALLTAAIIETPFPSQDLAALEWITGWEAPGLPGFFILVDWLTGLNAGLIYGVVGLPALLLVRQQKTAVAFVVVGAVLAAALLMVLVPMYRRFLQTGSVLGFTLPSFSDVRAVGAFPGESRRAARYVQPLVL